MPRSPRRPCRQPGCPNLAEAGEQYCSKHKSEANYEYNHYRRDADSKKHYGRAWKRIRDSYISRHPLCEECLKSGRYVPAVEVHHLIPLSNGGTHARDNLISLCHACHMKKHGELGSHHPHSADR